MNKKILFLSQDTFIPHKELMLRRAFDFVKHNRIPGDYFEFGLWKGKNFLNAILYQKYFQIPDLRLFGFDSFEGLPPPRREDQYGYKFQKGEFKGNYFQIQSKIEHERFSKKASLIPGWFKTTLKSDLYSRYNLQHASIVWIDSDLYESAKDVLRFIQPLLVDGTILIFDDWFLFKGNPKFGEQRAFNEWSKKYKIKSSEFFRYGWAGNSFIIHRL